MMKSLAAFMTLATAVGTAVAQQSYEYEVSKREVCEIISFKGGTVWYAAKAGVTTDLAAKNQTIFKPIIAMIEERIGGNPGAYSSLKEADTAAWAICMDNIDRVTLEAKRRQ